MQELGLVDIYRAKHPKPRTYTYESKPLKLKSRLDFFLIAEMLQNRVDRAETRASIAPDHKAIFLSIEIDTNLKRGPGCWKFNNQLLAEDDEYKKVVEDNLVDILDYYKDVTSKQLLWELIKMELRAKTISCSKAKDKSSKQEKMRFRTKCKS